MRASQDELDRLYLAAERIFEYSLDKDLRRIAGQICRDISMETFNRNMALIEEDSANDMIVGMLRAGGLHP